MKNKPYIIGLTGGIASGKSEACVILQSLGAYIIDADKVSRDVQKSGEKGYDLLKKEFPAFFDEQGNLLRNDLRKHVFDNCLTEKLNKIMFPIILDEIENRILSCEEDIVVVAAPLLIESGMNKVCDVVVTLDSLKETRISRMLARDNIDKELAEKIIDSQISDEQRNKLSDIVIYNNYGLDDLARKIKYYYEKIKKGVEEDN